MIFTGIGDEAANTIDGQIQATQELGWKHLEPRGVEVPGFPKANFHDIPDAAFDLAAAASSRRAGIGVYCFGSTIMNWSKKVGDPFDLTLAEVKRAIPRMQRLGTKYVRIMSFKPGDDEYRIPTEVFRRVKDVTNRFLDAGIQPVHENCMNYGGMSWQHALELLDKCPGLKWVFDTANPIFNPDRSKPKPWPRQDPWEFWTHVRDHVASHPHQGRHLEPGQERCRLQLARRRPGPGARHPQRRPGARLRRRPLHRTPHGGRLPRRPVQDHQRGGHAQELRRIRPPPRTDGG